MAKTTWVIVADGGRARLLANEGAGTGLVPATNVAYVADRRRTGEIGSERPSRDSGHGAGGVSTARHAVDTRVDWHQFEKAQFARQMAEILNQASLSDRFDRLVLIAPAKTLGELRAALGKGAADKIAGEIDKDLTKEPIDKLGGWLGDLVHL